jgi:D-aspartate ligase
MNNKALVIGLYVNGYSIIRELAKDLSIRIVGLDYEKKIGFASRYLCERYIVGYNENDNVLLDFLIKYGKEQSEKIVIFPTHDHHARLLAKYYYDLINYYYIPINPETIPIVIDKKNQYLMCEKIGIPYPKTIFINTQREFEELTIQIKKLVYPLVIKPLSRAENPIGGFAFRVIEIKNYSEFEKILPSLKDYVNHGFLISEIVPGEPDNIWAYTGYLNDRSKVIAGWTGRKLTQRPYYFGVFSTARCEFNPIIEEQGIKLLKAFNFIGIGEPEFKYDYRDNKYKLMEINPRYMMWHIAGMQGGVNLPLIQYYHMTGQNNKLENMQKKQDKKFAHIVFMESELLNVIDHKPKTKYIINVINSIMLKNKIWAIMNHRDPLPGIRNLLQFNLIRAICAHIFKS